VDQLVLLNYNDGGNGNCEPAGFSQIVRGIFMSESQSGFVVTRDFTPVLYN